MIPNVRFQNFIDHIQNEVLENPDFVSFVTGIFGRALSLYVGYVSQNPPKQSNCPLCMIIPDSTTITQMTDEYFWSFTIMFGADAHGIDRQDQTESIEAIDQLDALIKRFAGDLEESLCEKNATLSTSSFSFVYDDHPLLIASGEIRFTMQNILGTTTPISF